MAVDVVTDPIVLPVLVQLGSCLATWFEAQPDPPQFVGLRWGDYAPLIALRMDEACAGICWVRFVSVGDASQAFPATGGISNPCGPGLWGVSVEIGVARCAAQWPGPDDELPDQAAWDELVTQLTADMAVVRRAVRCCAMSQPTWKRLSWGAQTALPVEGNATGSTLALTIPVPDSTDCGGC